MTQALRLAALALWLASLLWPAAISPHGDTLLGIQLLASGTLLLAAWLPLTLPGAPWLWLGVLSNGLMLAELRRQRQQVDSMLEHKPFRQDWGHKGRPNSRQQMRCAGSCGR